MLDLIETMLPIMPEVRALVLAVTHHQHTVDHTVYVSYLFSAVISSVTYDGHGLDTYQGLDSFFFANSGGEAVEGALRLARQVHYMAYLQCSAGHCNHVIHSVLSSSCTVPNAAPI